MASDILQRIRQSVVNGEPEETADLVREALGGGHAPLAIVNEALIAGINLVGEEFQKGTYFLPDLILGAKAMEAGLAILQPLLVGDQEREPVARMVIGTVQGDLHDLGKKIVATLFRANGFEVHDLGVDVPTSAFVEKIREVKPHIVGLSALLTTTVHKQRELIETLTELGLRDRVKVMVGGAPITREWAEKIGADAVGADASQAVLEARRLLGL